MGRLSRALGLDIPVDDGKGSKANPRVVGAPPPVTQAPKVNPAWGNPQPRWKTTPMEIKRNPADPRVTAALEIAFAHCETDDPQRLKWIIDQMTRKLHERPQDYEVWVSIYNSRPAVRDWEQGRGP